MAIDLEKIFSHLGDAKRQLPPVHLWNPAHCGEINIRIDEQMQWFHDGRVFERPALVKLLSSILRIEDGQYFLVTPQEKMAIQVDDVPFEVIHMRQNEAFPHQKILVTNVEDVVSLDAAAVWELRTYRGETIPYVMVRDGLWARINRAVYYQMAEEAMAQGHEDIADLYLDSGGARFLLGSTAA